MNEDLIEFLKDLDDSPDINITDWEAKFLENILDKESAGGRIYLSPKQIDVIHDMQKKYEDYI